MKIKEFWTDPVLSNVIAAIIIALLGYIGNLVYPYINNYFTNLKNEFFHYQYFSIIFIIVLISIIAITTIIFLKKKRIKMLAIKYSENDYFFTLFSNSNSGEHTYSLVAHYDGVITLLEDLKKCKMINWREVHYPELTNLGIKIKKYLKKNELGLFN